MKTAITDISGELPAGRHRIGDGLTLTVRPSGGRSFSYVYRVGANVREVGIGPAAGPGREGLSIDQASAKAAEFRAARRDGQDPLMQKRKAAAEAAVLNDGTTFGEFATIHIKTIIAPGFKTGKAANDWQRSIEIHARPLLPMKLAEITAADVKAILLPIWNSKPKTAAELRGRIERILDGAIAHKKITGENVARWKGNLKELMPKLKRNEGHHAAAEYDAVPDIVAALQANDNPLNLSCRALEFLILTAARTTEVRMMTVGEVNFETATWTIPKERMKMDKPHRVPLSPRALEILRKQIGKDDPKGAFVFPGIGLDRTSCIGENAMNHCLKRFEPTATPHGMRSSFRDWVAEETTFDENLAEFALAHDVGTKVAQAYRRGDAFKKRRALMNAWADFVAGVNGPAPQEG